MLKKIFKHDTRAILHKILPMLAAEIAAGALICGLQILSESLYRTYGYTAVYATLVGLSGVLWASIPILFLLAVGTVIYLYHRALFSDEGYLTMVIPVSTHRLLLGKLLTGLLWMLVATLATGASILLAELSYIFTDGDIGLVYLVLQMLMGTAPVGGMDGIDWLYLVQSAIDLVFFLMLAYAAVTLGGCCFKRHKLLGAILFFFLGSMTQELVTVLVSLLFFTQSIAVQELVVLLTTILLSAVMIALLYVLSVRTLRRSFNIE